VCPGCGARLPVRFSSVCSCGLELPPPGVAVQTEPLLASRAKLVASRVVTVEPAMMATLDGGWRSGECWLVYGPAGSGKSRLALRWSSVALAAVWCLEMSPTQTAAVASSAGARCSNLRLSGPELGWRTLVGRRRLLVVDSVSEAPRPTALARAAREWSHATSSIAWLICHETGAGTPRGGTRLPHDVDAVVRVVPASKPGSAIVTVQKRRATLPGPPALVQLGAEPSP